MSDSKKYQGIIPAFYACYDEDGRISVERARRFARDLIDRGVNGLYVGGSSGECIYQHPEEREALLEAVVKEAAGRVTIIAHVACNNTSDSERLARHAEALGVDAIAAIPPIYFHLPEDGIAAYWNAISAAAPHTDFIIYNIPQLAGVALTPSLLKKMLKNPRVKGVKNSSMPVQDIEVFRRIGGPDFTVFNGPDEQLFSGLAAGARAGIGGTYAVMPELYLAIYDAYIKGETMRGLDLQDKALAIIEEMCGAKGNLYAVMKAILAKDGMELGSVRAPLVPLQPGDEAVVESAYQMIHDVRERML